MTNTTSPPSSGARTRIRSKPAKSPRARQAGGGAWLAAIALTCLSCTTTGGPKQLEVSSPPLRPAAAIPAELYHLPLDAERAESAPGPRTVEDSWILDVYTATHSKDHRTFRLTFPDRAGDEVIAHALIPPGPGPHPVVMVFPILAGSHVISEALAKALVNRHYAVVRMERREVKFKELEPEALTSELSAAVRDARRALDWVETRPELDPTRIGAAGISLGSLLAALVQAVDPRVRAGFYGLSGGGLAEILYDSREKPVRKFRNRVMEERALADREAFIAHMRPIVGPVDPLTYAGHIDPETVLMVTGRFDRIIPPARAEELWEALGHPRWTKLPTGHYQALPFFWYAIGRAADHFDEVLAPETHEGELVRKWEGP